MIGRDSRPRRQEQILNQQVEDNQILLKLGSGEYYALDEVGNRVWELCDGTHSVGDIVAIIHQEYDAPADTIETDIIELLQDLANEKLVVEAH